MSVETASPYAHSHGYWSFYVLNLLLPYYLQEQQKDNDNNNGGGEGGKGDNSERDRGYGDEDIFLEQAH